ncbi:S9 family peptidase [Thalassotalea crassostreae]|uniref:S9 family peptidase n=1 Tax=Thalassotalea crassostreae TaxID=1763536 RepID=UPI0009EF686F|nr:S9 family peptidase [Thalassotalea crassostreae]
MPYSFFKIFTFISSLTFAITFSSLVNAQSSLADATSSNEVNEPLTLERMYSSPALAGEKVIKLKYTADSKKITYLKTKQENRSRYDLWQYDIATAQHSLIVDADSIFSGIEVLSEEEKYRRERLRLRGSGIIEYFLSADSNKVVFPINGDLYLYTFDTKKTSRLTDDDDFETDIKFSPKGNFVSFIKQQNIYIIDLDEKTVQALTTDGSGTIKNGMAEFVAQEEMDRMSGYWWSPNEKYIAFLRVDESPVPTVIRNEIYADSIKLIEQRYPSAGSNNVDISLRTVRVSDGSIKKLNLGTEKDIYIARVKWLPDSKTVSYQWQDRSQKKLELRFHNLNSKKTKTILTESSDYWININDDLKFLSNGEQFIWASERDGFKHLYLYKNNGEMITQLTKGEWVVDKLVAVDESKGLVYFTGRADTPMEKHLYKTTLDGKAPEHVIPLTKRGGFHQITFAADKQTYIDNYSNINTPWQLSLHNVSGAHLDYLLENKVDEEHPLFTYKDNLVTPEFGSLIADDGKTKLFYRLYKPTNKQPGKRYPVIVSVYGGPHAQRVNNKWVDIGFNQYMANRGYVIFQLDNRGSNYRGTEFEFIIKDKLGAVELRDQISGVKYLRTLPFVDKNNIGVYGHSYGGYMALMAMFNGSEYFKAGVSGAPVTDWLLYDTHYTERYLSHPQNNADGYTNSSVFPYVANFNDDRGLLIYHGMADDNVLFTNTTKLIKALQNNNKQFELMTYPGSKHSMRGKKVKMHLYSTIEKFFDNQLKK